MFLLTKDFFKPKTSFSLQKSISVKIYEKMLLLFFMKSYFLQTLLRILIIYFQISKDYSLLFIKYQKQI